MPKISALPLLASGDVAPTMDIGPFVHNGVTYRVTVGSLVNAGLLAPGPMGSGTPNTGAFTGLTATTFALNGSALSLAGAFTTAGAFGVTLTATATTSITLPTTGTLSTLAGAEVLSAKTLTNPTINAYTEGSVAIGNSGTSKTLDISAGTAQTVTMTGNCTFTMPTATAGKSFTLLVNTGAGSFTGTFTGVKWPGNTAPTLTTTASRYDLLSFQADGTSWFGNYAQGYV